MKEWYFCVAVAGLLLSSCSQQVQERADGGKTSDTIITEVPVEETCDSTGYRLYRKYLAAIGENPSYFHEGISQNILGRRMSMKKVIL